MIFFRYRKTHILSISSHIDVHFTLWEPRCRKQRLNIFSSIQKTDKEKYSWSRTRRRKKRHFLCYLKLILFLTLRKYSVWQKPNLREETKLILYWPSNNSNIYSELGVMILIIMIIKSDDIYHQSKKDHSD